jgi:serine/threonine protein phosphatase 1
MKKVKHFEHNKVGRDFVVGDLHGCLEDFFILLDSVEFDTTKDRVFSVGDLVDRGPDSLECAKLIRNSWFHAVRGNHEQMMIDSVMTENSAWDGKQHHWLINGGDWSLQVEEQELKEVAKELDELPFVIVIGKSEEKRINIAHAEIYRNKDRDLATDEDIDDWHFDSLNETNMIWGRSLVGSKAYNKEVNPALSTTFVGHTPIDMPFELLNHNFIDLGACFWYKQQYTKAKLCLVDIQNEKAIILDVQTKDITEVVI